MRRFDLFTIILLIMGVFMISACHPVQDDKNVITVSIQPQKYFVEKLTSGSFEVNVMIPPGSSPATYEPTPRQMTDLNQSDLYFSIGMLGFENAWLPRIEKNHPDLKVINTSAGIQLIGEEAEGEETHDHNHEADDHDHDHHHHGVDPHIWMSPKQAAKMVNRMASALIMHDNACKDLINKNRDNLLDSINRLDEQFEVELSKIKNRKFIIFHPALTYLARDYNLEQIAMEYDGKEPSAAYLRKIVDRAKNEKIRLLFIQKEFDMENASQLAKEIDGQLIQIDPLAEDWFNQMHDILNKLKQLDADTSQ